MNTDAAVPGLNRENVYRLTVPTNDLAAGAYADFVTEFRQLIAHNGRQAETVAATRDLLLPKLMSGEIRLRSSDNKAKAST